MGHESEETTPVIDLDQAMRDGMAVFEGELAEAASDTSTPGTVLERPDEGPPEDREEEPPAAPAAGDAPPGTPSSEEEPPETPPPGDTDEDKGGEKPKPEEFRFKDHPEAEKGYKHVQGEKTRLEAKVLELTRKLEEKERQEEMRQARETADQEYEDFVTERTAEALTAIDELDAEADDYQTQVARVMAKKDRVIRAYEREHAPAMQPPPQAPASTDEDTPPDWDEVKRQAKEMGIDPEDEYFALVCASTPSANEAGEPIPFADQLAQAVEKTKTYQTAQRTRFEDGQREAAHKQNTTHAGGRQPMPSSTATKPPAAKPKPVSLNDAIESAAESRRL